MLEQKGNYQKHKEFMLSMLMLIPPTDGKHKKLSAYFGRAMKNKEDYPKGI
jgi:hypothetical protein